MYSLIMSGHYDRDVGLDSYLLALIHTVKGHINQWRCTSSQAHSQKLGSDYIRGGLIPPTYHCQDLTQYQVLTKSLDLTHIAGVRGSFYQILPYQIDTLQGTKRSDFGIHLDANVPGSMGCIVMDGINFVDFERQMSKLAAVEQIPKIPLHVFYS
jgi:hypothetical protein